MFTNDYKFASLENCCQTEICKLEEQIASKTGKNTVLIAYEKK